MLLFFWRIYWIFKALVVIPLRQKRNKHNFSVRLAKWAYEHQHYHLYRNIQLYWKVRNWGRSGAGTVVSSWWFNLTLSLRPKCKKHNYSLFSFEYCFLCGLEEAQRKYRLQELTAGRKR